MPLHLTTFRAFLQLSFLYEPGRKDQALLLLKLNLFNDLAKTSILFDYQQIMLPFITESTQFDRKQLSFTENDKIRHFCGDNF